MLNKILENQTVKKLVSFFNSYYYPAFLFAVVLLTHCLALDILGFIITVLCFFLTTVLCEDFRPAIPFILMFPYVVSTQNSPGYDYSEYYANHTTLWILFSLGILVILAFTIRAITRKEYRTFFDFKNKKLLIGFLLLIPCYALAGVFSKWLDFHSLVVAVLMIILQPIIYIIFSSGTHSKEDNLLYFSKIAALAILLMALEIAYVYVLRYSWGTPLNDDWKAKIIIGCGISNSAGKFITILLPFLFYASYKEKRGYVYYILAAISLIAVYFTLSRGALFFSLPTFAIGTLFLCFKGNYKKLFRIISFCYVALITLALIIVYATGNLEGLFEFFKTAGFSNRGRFEIWADIYDKFKESPIFGVGFSTYMQTRPDVNQVFKFLAHNTAIQILCSTGIVGAILFLYHIFEVVKLIIKNHTINIFVFAFALFLFVGISMVDQTYFVPNFTIIYTLFLVFAEKEAA